MTNIHLFIPDPIPDFGIGGRLLAKEDDVGGGDFCAAEDDGFFEALGFGVVAGSQGGKSSDE